MELLSVSGCRISTARSLTGERHETTPESAALAVPRKPSQELDRATRLRLAWEIQRKLEADVARPMFGWRKKYFTVWLDK
jgi:hypothetical protein